MSETQTVREYTHTTTRLVVERKAVGPLHDEWLYYTAWDDNPHSREHAIRYMEALRKERPDHTYRLIRRAVTYHTTEEVVC